MTRKAYLAKAGLKLSDSGGRQVVDKWYGMEGGDAVFSGSDRPEFNPLDPAVCVEEERENLGGDTNDVSNLTADGSTLSATSDGWVAFTESDEEEAHRVSFALSSKVEGARYAFGARFRNYLRYLDFNFSNYAGWAGTPRLTYDTVNGEFSETGGFIRYGVEDHGDHIYMWGVIEAASDGSSIIYTMSSPSGSSTYQGAGHTAEFKDIMLEVGDYPTLWAPGTRLAPFPAIPNFLPETGHISGWVDIINSEAGWNFIFNTSDPRTRLYIAGQNVVFSTNMGSEHQLSLLQSTMGMEAGNRYVLGFLCSYDENGKTLYIAFPDGRAYKNTSQTGHVAATRDLLIGWQSPNGRS